MNKKKILLVGYSTNMGGIERFLTNVCKYIDKERFEIGFLIFKGKKVCFQDELENIGCKFYKVTNRKKNYIQYLKDLKKVYTENDFDIIHFNIMNFSLFERIILASKYSKARIIIHSHSSGINKVYKKTKFFDKIGRFFCRNIEYEKIACGQEAGKWLFEKKDFLVLNNGMEVEKFKFDESNRKKIRDELSISEDTKVLGHVGALVPVKNHKFLIDVFHEYQKLEINSKLILVGEGFLQDELKEQVKKLQIENKVLFLGRRDDTEKIYSAMDTFILPSLFEGLSISIVEAQINGLKCYTSTNVARESDVTGNVQFLSLDENAEYWAKNIFENDNSRDEEAINRIPKEFRIEETVKKLSEIYEEI